MLTEFKTIAGGNITSPTGFTADAVNAGIRKSKKDLAVLYSETAAVAAALYTLNQFPAAPLTVTKAVLSETETLQAVVVNSGNANAYTGQQGIEDAWATIALTAKALDLDPSKVAVASTGVIGVTLPMERIEKGLEELAKGGCATQGGVDQRNQGGAAFSEAIMTTDTRSKELAVEIEIDGKTVTIGGAAKGSGMINPNMGTMLAFVTTDAAIEPQALNHLLRSVTDQTYNMVTVDGDTSTNDMVLVLANGMAGNLSLNEYHPDWNSFQAAFLYVNRELARMIAADGEGATKLITVKVVGASELTMARTVAKRIVGSNLVKAAVYGADPNWGRVIMAIGNSGYEITEELLDIAIGEVQVIKQGAVTAYDEKKLIKQLEQGEVQILVNFNQGTEKATAWGCDLTYDYVRINASYRT
jgi:glutamate N-acetyltransferase/amino-acid N-acetyltransferase